MAIRPIILQKEGDYYVAKSTRRLDLLAICAKAVRALIKQVPRKIRLSVRKTEKEGFMKVDYYSGAECFRIKGKWFGSMYAQESMIFSHDLGDTFWIKIEPYEET